MKFLPSEDIILCNRPIDGQTGADGRTAGLVRDSMLNHQGLALDTDLARVAK